MLRFRKARLEPHFCLCVRGQYFRVLCPQAFGVGRRRLLPRQGFHLGRSLPLIPGLGSGAQRRHAVLESFHLLGQPLELSSLGEAHASKRAADRYLHVVAILSG